MSVSLRHPAFILMALGSASGLLGTCLIGGNYGAAPQPGAYFVLTGLWFGVVIAFAVWRWGEGSHGAIAIAALTTWIAWEVAVNVAIQLDGPLLEQLLPTALKSYVAGFVAGAVGAIVTWAGVSVHVPLLRRPVAAISIVSVGAFVGLLLPATNYCDSGAVLLVPWQAAVAGLIGLNLIPVGGSSRRSEVEFVTGG